MGKSSWKFKPKNGGSNDSGGGDLQSCRGHGVIIATCDSAREREASKELVNLLSELIEELYHPVCAKTNSPDNLDDKRDLSVQEQLQREIEALKADNSAGKGKSQFQHVKSIQTGSKGLVCIRISRSEFCPVFLVRSLFQRVKERKLALTRYTVRIIPLQLVFYPREDELKENAFQLLKRVFDLPENTGENGDEDKEPVFKALRYDSPRYSVQFKARNHDVLHKEPVQATINAILRGVARPDYLNPQALVLVEALKNICGISYFNDFDDFGDLNLRKYQAKYTAAGLVQPSLVSPAAVQETTVACVSDEVSPNEASLDKEESSEGEEYNAKEDINS